MGLLSSERPQLPRLEDEASVAVQAQSQLELSRVFLRISEQKGRPTPSPSIVQMRTMSLRTVICLTCCRGFTAPCGEGGQRQVCKQAGRAGSGSVNPDCWVILANPIINTASNYEGICL